MATSRPRILLVERTAGTTPALIARLRERGLTVTWARDAAGARRAIESGRLDGLVARLDAARLDGLALMRRARTRHPHLCAVLLADPPLARAATAAMREGAYDVLETGADPGRVTAVLERGLAHQRMAARLAELESRSPDPSDADPFHGRSRAIARVMDQVRHLASTHAPVLIEGEAGTGKGLAARAIHAYSPRRAGPFVSIDCAAWEGGGLEAELFGVDASAPDVRPGLIERAEGGTLFLDEIGAAPAGVQIRLLRLVQERAFESPGARAPVRADVRLVTATRRDLAALVREGGFRDDLLRRLGMVRITMPPLRQRLEDIPLLVERFLRDLNRGHRRRVRGVTPGVLERLERHLWPGNVRELRDTIERMAVAAAGGRPLDLADLPPALRSATGEPERIEIAPGMTVEEAERLLITATLDHAGGDKPRAAAMLGIGLRTLYRKIQAYGIG